MAIPHTTLHEYRVWDQIVRNTTTLQNDMRLNAMTNLAVAVAQSGVVETLATDVNDTAQNYLRRLAWIATLLDDEAKRARLLVLLAGNGCTEQDLKDLCNALHAVAVYLLGMPKTTFAEIAAACQWVLDNVDPLESLWIE